MNTTVFALKGKGSRKEIKHTNYNSVPALSVGEVRIPLTAFNSKSIKINSWAFPGSHAKGTGSVPGHDPQAVRHGQKKKKIISLQNTQSV